MQNLDITELLVYCSEDISRRQGDIIHNEASLLNILEKRDLINKCEVENNRPLTLMKLKEAITKYNPPNIIENVYATERIREEEEIKLKLAKIQANVFEGDRLNNNMHSRTMQHQQKFQQPHSNQPQSNSVNNNVPKSLFEERKAWVYREISVEIGKKWRDFGRGIGIREGEMDSLEVSCRGIEERIYKMLAKLEENEFNNLERVYYVLIKSLEENCNRRKLSDKIRRAMIR